MKKQSKRAAFYYSQRRRRVHRRICRQNAHKPGFVGVASRLKIDGKCYPGPGAVFVGVRP